MARAGIFIGVDRSGDLQPLNDAATGAARMHAWALQQGFADETHAKLITDANRHKVTPDRIYDAIEQILSGAGVDQLIVYFAGHGVRLRRSEHWLLTDAPTRANAAVDVSSSVELARYCGVGHVVLISDACRVAPEGIHAQNVSGVDIFPNEGDASRAKPVDQFFACVLGRVASEIKDPAVLAGNFSALYTNALLAALQGKHPQLLDYGERGDTARYLRPRRLAKYLEVEIPKRVQELNLQFKVNQEPDAIITSDGSWLSRLEALVPARPRRRVTRGFALTAEGPPQTVRSVARQLVHSATQGEQSHLTEQMEEVRVDAKPEVIHLVDTAERIAKPFGPDHFETQCGIKTRGVRIAEVFASRARATVLGDESNIVRVEVMEGPVATALLRFDGGFGMAVPLIEGFVAAISCENGEVIDVAYEPSANSWRWEDYKAQAANVRSLRAVAAAASLHGRFRLDRADAARFAQRMQYAKGLDPTLALYAAYAYHDLQMIDRIDQMSRYLRGDIGASLFDIELLRRSLVGTTVTPANMIAPFFPLLSQGWALLRANRVKLHPALSGIEDSMRDSVWTTFNYAGLEKVKDALASGEAR
jgi:hypothetical protein